MWLKVEVNGINCIYFDLFSVHGIKSLAHRRALLFRSWRVKFKTYVEFVNVSLISKAQINLKLKNHTRPHIRVIFSKDDIFSYVL